MSFIPTFYKSGTFSGGLSTGSCAITRYMPVDYWSQSFTVYTAGQNLKVTVTPPNGAKVSNYENIIDQDTYLDIRQYIIRKQFVLNFK